MKQLLPVSSYKGYVFSILPLSPLSGEVLTMVYTKGSIDAGMVEFDISTKKYKSVTADEYNEDWRKLYFIMIQGKASIIASKELEQYI